MVYGTLRKELIFYLLVGVSGMALDAGCFYWLRSWGWGVLLTNTVARHLGAVYTFWANRVFTFTREEDEGKSIGREAVLYLLLLYASMSVSTLCLWVLIDVLELSRHLSAQTMAKIGVDGLCAVANFVVCKWLIFKKTRTSCRVQ
jgi:putative flippase GtrA